MTRIKKKSNKKAGEKELRCGELSMKTVFLIALLALLALLFIALTKMRQSLV